MLKLSLLIFRYDASWDQSVNIFETRRNISRRLFFIFAFKFRKGNLEMSADNADPFSCKIKNNTLLFSVWTTLPACHCLVCQQQCVVISYQYKEIISFIGYVS